MDLVTERVARLLLERDRQLSVIASLTDEAVTGEGRVAVIQAGAGLGKSAFLDECARRLTDAGVRVLAARGSELEREFGYAVVRQLLAAVRRPADLRAAVLAGPAHAAEILFAEAQPGAPTAHETEPFELMTALYWVFANLCDLGPVALLVDDAHDADDASVRFLSFLARRLADLPVLLVVAARPVRVAGAGSLADRLHEGDDTLAISLEPLSPAAVSTVLETSLGTTPSPDFVKACERATGGNPFYLRELVRAVADSDARTALDSFDQVAEVGPETIRRRLVERLAVLPPAAIPLAQACAVLGEGARLPICARLAEVSLDSAAEAADALVREGVLAPGPYLAFLHPILQAAVLSDLGDHSRRRWHARAARILEDDGFPAELVALHLIRTDPSGDQHVRDVLIHAGRAAAYEGSPALAAQYLARALDEAGPMPDADLLYDLGLAEASLGDPSGIGHMSAGVAATSDPHERARRALRLADLQMRSGDLIDAVHMLERVRDAAADDDELLLSVDTCRYWAGRLHPQTRGAAMELAGRLRERFVGADVTDSRARRMLLAYLGCEAAQSESASVAVSLLEQAMAPPGLLDFLSCDEVATQATMLSLCSLERYDEFDGIADRALADAGRRGAVLAFLVIATFRALAMWHRGELASAETECREAMQAARELGWKDGPIGLIVIRAMSLLDQGDIAGARDVLADHASIDTPPGFPTALMLFGRGRLAAEHNDPERARDHLLACAVTLERMNLASPAMIPWRAYAVPVLVALGDVAAARRMAEEDLAAARRLAGSIAAGRALHGLAQLERGADRVRLLEDARAVIERGPGRLVRAQILVDLGAALRQSKRAAEAREQLMAGLDLAGSCGAAPLVARAREELGILGVTPRGARIHGPDALTPSEVRVARLAAAGRSNAEIAQQLFVTRKTVEKHLASTYRKLGIQSRTELAKVGMPPP